MPNIGTSVLLLVVALLLLWLAVTDKLSNLLDAWDVATGKATASTAATTVSSVASAAVGNIPKLALNLPALPALGSTASIGIA